MATLINQDGSHKRLLLETVSASATNASETIAVSPYFHGTIQVIHAGHTAGTSTWEIQNSFDGTNWDTVPSTSTTTSGVSGSASKYIDPLPGGNIRIKITAANGSVAPTYTIYFEGRRA